MKRSAFILLTLLAPLFSRAQQPDTTTFTKVGDTAPLFDFAISKTQKVNLKDYHGKIVLLNFFATWCPPCRMELPRVQKEIWEKYKDNPKFALFVFGREEGWNVVLPFNEKFKYTFPILPDDGPKIFKLYATQSIPRNVVVDGDGKIIYQSIMIKSLKMSLIGSRLEKERLEEMYLPTCDLSSGSPNFMPAETIVQALIDVASNKSDPQSYEIHQNTKPMVGFNKLIFELAARYLMIWLT